jgi:hypothetical protein
MRQNQLLKGGIESISPVIISIQFREFNLVAPIKLWGQIMRLRELKLAAKLSLTSKCTYNCIFCRLISFFFDSFKVIMGMAPRAKTTFWSVAGRGPSSVSTNAESQKLE